jgi:hypothetical protein
MIDLLGPPLTCGFAVGVCIPVGGNLQVQTRGETRQIFRSNLGKLALLPLLYLA